LAARGYLEYIPYKGARFTNAGLVHGQKMKRRHRLAEVLLDLLPYEGDPHATACRLEHAIDDDMEVALSRLITPETKDPSGREIPQPTPDIAERLSKRSSSVSLMNLDTDTPATLSAIFKAADEAQALDAGGFRIGSIIVRTGPNSFVAEGQEAILSERWMNCVFVEILNDTV